jgi:hypothetical protein
MLASQFKGVYGHAVGNGHYSGTFRGIETSGQASVKFLLARSMRTQADLVDHLFNSSEKRLARILLLMAQFGVGGESFLM